MKVSLASKHSVALFSISELHSDIAIEIENNETVMVSHAGNTVVLRIEGGEIKIVRLPAS